MKLRWFGLTVINILIATNIYEGETRQLNASHLKRNQKNNHSMKPSPVMTRSRPQRPYFKTAARRISETKCLEYIGRQNEKRKSFVEALQIGGRTAVQGEFPHMGALGWRTVRGSWTFKCGSSLISPKFAVTAAHCSKIKKDSNIANRVPEIVRFGENDIIDPFTNPIDANILRIIVHPQYVSPNQYYDIALIEFKSALEFSLNVQPVCLWNSFNTSRLGTKVTSTGWGVVNTVTKELSPTLQATVMDIIDSKQCDRLLRRACNQRWCGFREHQLCAGKLSGGVDACQGDSGGPLQVKVPLSGRRTMHYLVGVTSFGIGCARPNMPGVYTRVSSFVDWIERIVWPH